MKYVCILKSGIQTLPFENPNPVNKRRAGTDRVGETFSLKKGRTFYYIRCYLREELKDDSLKTIEEIFATGRRI